MADEQLFNDLKAVNAAIGNLWRNHPDEFHEAGARKIETAWFPFWQSMNQIGIANEGDAYLESEDEDREFTYYELCKRFSQL